MVVEGYHNGGFRYKNVADQMIDTGSKHTTYNRYLSYKQTSSIPPTIGTSATSKLAVYHLQ